MAEETKKIERIYTIPLRKFWVRVPEYKRSRKAVLAVKKFIAKHMKVADRDLDKVKLDVHLNNDIWFKGHAKPPSKVTVKAVKEGELVHVTFAETPKHVAFLKIKQLKLHKKEEQAPVSKKEEQAKETKTEEQKTDEKEKEKAVEQQNIKEAKQDSKAQKSMGKVKEPKIQRMALQK